MTGNHRYPRTNGRDEWRFGQFTEVPKLQDVQGPKSMPPPSTAVNCLNLFCGSPLAELSGASRGFLNFILEAEILGEPAHFVIRAH